MSKYGHRPHDWFDAIIDKLGGEAEGDAFLRDELMVSKPCSTLVMVDFSQVIYPEWVIEKLYFRRSRRPSSFTMESLSEWVHDDQKTIAVTGGFLYEFLQDNHMIESCLGYAELLAIQKLGILAFRKYFAGKEVFGWCDVVQHRDGCYRVPYLVGDGNKVYLYWCWLGNNWSARRPALRFEK